MLPVLGTENFSHPLFALMARHSQWEQPPGLPTGALMGRRTPGNQMPIPTPALRCAGDFGTDRLRACGSRPTLPTPALCRFGRGEGAIPRSQPEGSKDTRGPSRSRVQRPCPQSSSEQASYRLLPHLCESSLTTLLLLSKSNPLRWASIWGAIGTRFPILHPY